MAFFRTSISWRHSLRWYERAALVLWWLVKIVCVLCALIAAWLLLAGDFDAQHQSSIAALLLIGLGSLVAGRVVLSIATRRRRWHRLRL